MIRRVVATLVLLTAGCSAVTAPPAVGLLAHGVPCTPRAGVTSEELFGLAPIAGPIAPEDLGGVFVRGDLGWAQGPAFERYERHVPAPDELTVGSLLRMVEIFERHIEASTALDGLNGPEVRQRLVFQLSRLRSALRASGDPDAGVWGVFKVNPEIGREDWVPQDLSEHESLESDLVYFSASHTPESAFALAADRTSGGDDGPLSREFYTYLAEDAAAEVRTVVLLVRRAIDSAFPIDDISRDLARNDLAWKNYLRRGYSQYPWELYLNSFVVDSAWDDPPRHQLVLLHPEAAAFADLDDLDTASTGVTILLHGLGYVYYGGRERDWFLGVSGTVSVSDDSAYGIGYGGTLHLGGARLSDTIPHLSLSILHHEGTDGLAIAVGVDVWRLLSSPDLNAVRALFDR